MKQPLPPAPDFSQLLIVKKAFTPVQGMTYHMPTLTTEKPLAGPKPEVMLDLREWSLASLVSIAEIMKLEPNYDLSPAFLHIRNWLGHKGIRT